MASKLEGLANLSGQVIKDQFEVIRPTGHRRYAVRCNKCRTLMEGYRHDDLLTNPRCFNRACGKKQAFKTWKAEYEHEQQEQINELDSRWKKSLNELAATEKTLIMHAKDAEFEQSEELRATRMPSMEEAQRFTVEQIDIFIRETPEFLPCEHNRRQLIGYLERNGIDCFTDAKTLRKAYDRLRQYGLLEERPPAPEPEPEPIVEPVSVDPVLVDDGEDGYDEKTGQPLKLTKYQVARLSGDEYMRFKRIPFSQLVRPVNPVR